MEHWRAVELSTGEFGLEFYDPMRKRWDLCGYRYRTAEKAIEEADASNRETRERLATKVVRVL